jgi:hypothetical protein
MRLYIPAAALVAVAALCLASGLACLHISAVIAVSAGYAPVANLEAFGRSPDSAELRRAWRTQARFQSVGYALLTLSVPFAIFAARSVRRVRKTALRVERAEPPAV